MLQGSHFTYCGIPGHKFDPLVAFQPPSTLLLQTSTGIQFVQLHVDLPDDSAIAGSATATATVETTSPAQLPLALRAEAASPNQAASALEAQVEAVPEARLALPSEQHQAASSVTQHHADSLNPLWTAHTTDTCHQGNSRLRSSLNQDTSGSQGCCMSPTSSPQHLQPGLSQQQPSHKATLQDCNQQQQCCALSLHEQQQYCQPGSCHQQVSPYADKGTDQQQSHQCVEQLPCYRDKSEQHAAQMHHASVGEAVQADCTCAASQSSSAVHRHHSQEAGSAAAPQASRSVWSLSPSSAGNSASDALQQDEAVLSSSDAGSSPTGTWPPGRQPTRGRIDFTCRLPFSSRKLPVATTTLHSRGPRFFLEHFIACVLPCGTLEHYAVSDYSSQVVLQTTASNPSQPRATTKLGIVSDPVEAVIVIAAMLNARLPTTTDCPLPHQAVLITSVVQANTGT